jgi:hypothetical protein
MRSRAEERVRRSDEENAWFYRYFFGLDWKDRTRYDLVAVGWCSGWQPWIGSIWAIDP